MENTSPQVIVQPTPTPPAKPRFKFSKRTLAIIFVAIIAIVVPLTISLVSHQQDNRQRASAADCQQLTLTFAQMKATGVCNYQGSSQCVFIQKQIDQSCSGVAILTPKPTSSAVSESSQGNNNVICAEVITYARNNTTHTCQQFPTSCLPSGWTSDPTCNPTVSIAPSGTTSTTPTPTCTPYPTGCIVNGQNVCAFFAAPRGGWCPRPTTTSQTFDCFHRISGTQNDVCPSGQSCVSSGPDNVNSVSGTGTYYPGVCVPTTACPQLAKLCPDGSSVSPSGPNCTMPACPGTPSATPSATKTPTPTVAINQCSVLTQYYKTVLGTQICTYNQAFCNQIKTQLQAANCPVPSITPIANASVTPGSTCALKSKGDANCDGKVNIIDFNSWRDNYLLGSNPTATPPSSFLVADFNGDGAVNILDFNIWRDGFLSTTVPH
ncbi:MAG TPA: dockerin type I repeat-containing protein [Patescibacteria group bacterium]|nr:dockerin type I repeat-containing protein [Patescibacteria group bacterium]